MTDSTSAVHTVFVVLTIISSIFARVSPSPDFYRVYKNKSTGEVAVLPVILLGTNCCVLTIYGYLVNNIFPLFVVAVFGIFTSAGFIAIFYKWTQNRATVRRVFGINLLVVLLTIIYTVIALTTNIIPQSRNGVNRTVGWVTIAASIAMFGSPLATIKKVVIFKSALSLPFTMCLTNSINCLLWVGLTLIAPDMFVMIPNVAGAVLAIVQVILWLIYRPEKSHAVQAIDGSNGDLEIQVCTSTSDDSLWHKSLHGVSPCQESSSIELDTNFAAVRSPASHNELAIAR